MKTYESLGNNYLRNQVVFNINLDYISSLDLLFRLLNYLVLIDSILTIYFIDWYKILTYNIFNIMNKKVSYSRLLTKFDSLFNKGFNNEDRQFYAKFSKDKRS